MEQYRNSRRMNTDIIFYKELQPFLKCKDHSVSKESYSVLLNPEFEMLVTQPVPNNLSEYYISEAYISHTDSNKKLIDKIYQRVKKHALKKKLQLTNSFDSPEKKLLDVGSGTGDFLATCNRDGWNTFGVEPSENARRYSEEKNILAVDDIDLIKEANFDIITLWHVLEHVPNLETYIQKLEKLLSPNGTLLIAVPNFKSYDAIHYKEYWAAFDVPRHLWHFSQNSIDKLFSQVSMKVKKTIPMKFDSYYVSLLSEKYKKGKNNFLNAFRIGFLSNYKAKRSTEYSSLIYVLKKDR